MRVTINLTRVLLMSERGEKKARGRERVTVTERCRTDLREDQGKDSMKSIRRFLTRIVCCCSGQEEGADAAFLLIRILLISSAPFEPNDCPREATPRLMSHSLQRLNITIVNSNLEWFHFDCHWLGHPCSKMKRTIIYNSTAVEAKVPNKI
jgi:hypothetical protein